MFRNLIVLCVLALTGCVSYSDPRYGAREPVYSDGSYYSPSAEGYGDYYYGPESHGRYNDDYWYDSYHYSDRYYRSPFWMSGQSPWCSYGHRYGYVYRPCSYGYGYGRPWGGWGLTLFFGDRWGGGYGGWGGGWNHWPYDHPRRWYRDRDRHDRDDDRYDDRPRQPRPPSDGDRNRRYPSQGIGVPRIESGREPPVRTRPIQGDRNERPRNDRPLMERPNAGVPQGNDRNAWGNQPPPRPREDGGYRGVRVPSNGSRNGAPPTGYPGQRVEPRPVAVERPQRPPVERDDRDDRNDRAERVERRREDDRPEPRARPRLQ